jgi:chromosome segregation ATPase
MEEKILAMLNKMNERLGGIETEIRTMKTEIDSVKTEIGSVKTEISSMKTEISSMKSEISAIKVQQEENTRILRALEHSTQVNKAEHEQMMMEMAEISKEVKNLRKDVSNVEVITASNWTDLARLKAVK